MLDGNLKTVSLLIRDLRARRFDIMMRNENPAAAVKTAAG
jgi:hypothetical protein